VSATILIVDDEVDLAAPVVGAPMHAWLTQPGPSVDGKEAGCARTSWCS
jgi:hypothetical protein